MFNNSTKYILTFLPASLQWSARRLVMISSSLLDTAQDEFHIPVGVQPVQSPERECSHLRNYSLMSRVIFSGHGYARGEKTQRCLVCQHR